MSIEEREKELHRLKISNKVDEIYSSLEVNEKEISINKDKIKELSDKLDSFDLEEIASIVLNNIEIPEPEKVDIKNIVDTVLNNIEIPKPEKIDYQKFIPKKFIDYLTDDDLRIISEKITIDASQVENLPKSEVKYVHSGGGVSKLDELRDVNTSDLTKVNGKYVLGGVTEAPKDSTSYARNDGEWVEVSGGGVQQYADLASFPATGEEDILYVAQDTNLAYRWDGTAYVEVAKSSSLIRDTRENIMALTPDDGTEAISTDFRKKMIYLSGQWYESSAILDERASPVDAGVVQNSNISGYGRDYITDKHIANSTIGEYNGEKENAVKITTIDGTKFLQVYMDGEWKTVLSGINIEVDEAEPDVEVTDFAPYRISLITGNSDVTDTNGTPFIQNMKTDAGAIQTKLVINGGTF